uniref:Uncharacterized protein n=1 Tax=Candidatus Kentrum sp. UNK TaxID=2126344 RepID=A0A451ANN4_9GAMM|nr:MAG: hypothetical protein BECKUNK1418G_GA0071005_11565 [Candidatus Kentron sp. UNK]VFK72921.1 MAG: hypothetical protein BECKUNK1418H_GA0071006_11495 [Candidatus Kentron sp. UNK]
MGSPPLFTYRKNKDSEKPGLEIKAHPPSVLARSANMFRNVPVVVTFNLQAIYPRSFISCREHAGISRQNPNGMGLDIGSAFSEFLFFRYVNKNSGKSETSTKTPPLSFQPWRETLVHIPRHQFGFIDAESCLIHSRRSFAKHADDRVIDTCYGNKFSPL